LRHDGGVDVELLSDETQRSKGAAIRKPRDPTRRDMAQRLGGGPAKSLLLTVSLKRKGKFSDEISALTWGAVMQGKVFVLGLAGPSGSGKSTVARALASHLNGHVISMETYAVAVNQLSFDDRAKRNYDEPEATDVKLLESHLRKYAAGNDIEAPIYDFAQHLRSKRTERVTSKPLLIVEGILALHFAELRPHYNLAIYLEAPDEVCFRRRKVRDITERQRAAEYIKWQWEYTVLPAAERYCLPSKRYADVVIDSTSDLTTVEKGITEAISQKRAKAAAR
jgi:uridine kinase